MEFYEPMIPESWREMRRAEQEAERAAEAESAAAKEARKTKWRNFFISVCKCLGYALGVVVILALAVVGILAAVDRPRR